MTAAVHVSNADSGDVRVYHLDAERGELNPTQRMMVAWQVTPLALGPSKRFP